MEERPEDKDKLTGARMIVVLTVSTFTHPINKILRSRFEASFSLKMRPFILIVDFGQDCDAMQITVTLGQDGQTRDVSMYAYNTR